LTVGRRRFRKVAAQLEPLLAAVAPSMYGGVS